MMLGYPGSHYGTNRNPQRNSYWSSQDQWRLNAVNNNENLPAPTMNLESSLRFKDLDDQDDLYYKMPDIDISNIRD